MGKVATEKHYVEYVFQNGKYDAVCSCYWRSSSEVRGTILSEIHMHMIKETSGLND